MKRSERLETIPAVAARWTARRRRVRQLFRRWPYAAGLLRLYGELLDTQERAFLAAVENSPGAEDLVRYVVEEVVPRVVIDTIAAGPPALVTAARERQGADGMEAVVQRWLGGDRQDPVDDYLARAATLPVLEALGTRAAAVFPGPRGEGDCPCCGGRPQLSYFSESGEALVTPPRRLICSRCGTDWTYERMTCPACGERSTGKLPIYADADRLPHLRADACESCRRYLITVDLRRDPEAVPVVDELVALPLDLHMQEQGFAKIVPNLLGT